MKRYFILFLGSISDNHQKAEIRIAQEFPNLIHGFEFLPYYGENYDERVQERLDHLYEIGVEPILMKGYNIHTEEYIRPIIRYYKNKHPNEKFFLSHCAIFPGFILTDGALLTKYTYENIEQIIKNAIELRNKTVLSYSKRIAMLNAGGDTNPNTAPEYWLEIYNKLPKETTDYSLEMSQLDVAIDNNIRYQKLGKETVLPTIIIPSCINEANSIWKSLTVMAKQSLAGVVMGLPIKIGLTSRTDSEDSIYMTLKTLLTLKNTL